VLILRAIAEGDLVALVALRRHLVDHREERKARGLDQ
jgi:hypothetical protein